MWPYMYAVDGTNVKREDLLAELASEAERDRITGLAVRVVVSFVAQVLVLKLRDDSNSFGNSWELPYGMVEPGESPVEAVTRVVTEQTGLDTVDVRSFLGSHDSENDSHQLIRQYNFVANVKLGIPVVGDRHANYAWVRPDQELPLTSAADQSAASDYFAGLRR